MIERQAVQRSELRRLANSVANLAQTLEQVEDFPTDTARDFCRIIKETASLIGAHISRAPEGKLLHVHFLLIQFGEHLRYPERSRIEQTPWSVVQATESFLQAHVGSKCKFIVRPQWHYNYALVGDFIEAYTKQITELKDWLPLPTWRERIGNSLETQIYCISFPRVEKMNVLLHVNWGHEVGHILARDWLRTRFGNIWKANTAGIRRRLRAMVMKPYTGSYKPPGMVVNAKVADLLKETMHLARATLKELISDAVGAHLFGPAALASLGEFSCHNVLDANPLQCRGYPPWRYRLRAVSRAVVPSLKRADKSGWQEILKTYAQWTEAWTDIAKPRSDHKIIDADMRSKEAYALIKANWPRIWRQVLSQLPRTLQMPYRLQLRHHVVSELIERLEGGIPPNETGVWPDTEPASLADIWNAAWACKIYHFKKEPGPLLDYYLGTLFQLTLKAIETSYVHGEYRPLLAQQEAT